MPLLAEIWATRGCLSEALGSVRGPQGRAGPPRSGGPPTVGRAPRGSRRRGPGSQFVPASPTEDGVLLPFTHSASSRLCVRGFTADFVNAKEIK